MPQQFNGFNKLINKLIKRRDFFLNAATALGTIGLLASGCSGSGRDYPEKGSYGKDSPKGIAPDPSLWWHKDGFIVHETVDTSRLAEGIIRSLLDGLWREFKVIDLPSQFLDWSLKARVVRLMRMLEYGGMDPRDLAGSHNACVATYGGPGRDSAVSINTAYKGMGFAVKADKLPETIQRINEERIRIEKDTANDPFKEMQAKVKFLTEFYQNSKNFDRSKQVSLELFTSSKFHTHTFLNMMANPIASASFLAFPTFEIRAVPQLLHPKNPGLSKNERNLLDYAIAIHDFIHSGSGERMACVYHVIELFDDTPNDASKGIRLV